VPPPSFRPGRAEPAHSARGRPALNLFRNSTKEPKLTFSSSPRPSLFLLGPPVAKSGETLLIGPAFDRPLALLAYLAAVPGLHPREELARLLWPESPLRPALANLSSNLYTLQKRMGGDNPLEATRTSLGWPNTPFPFDAEPVDVRRYFRDSPPQGCDGIHSPIVCKNCRRHLEKLKELGRRPFLEGASLTFSLPYAEWVETVRERQNLRLSEIERALSSGGDPLPDPEAGRLRQVRERRQLTVLAAVCSFPPDTDPESRIAARERLRERASPLVRKMGGTLHTPPGEDLVAFFGFPTATEDGARKAVRCAREILGAGSPKDPPLRIGLHTGESLSDVTHGIPDEEGDLVREAGAAAKTGKPGEISATFGTVRLVEDTVFAERRGAPAAETSGQTTGERVVYRILSDRKSPALHRIPPVGREREQGILWEEWKKARNEGLRIVWVTGEAGIGKSALVQDLARKVEKGEAGGQVRTFYCESLTRETPWAPAVRFLRSRVGLDEPLPSREKRYRVERYLLSLDAPVATALPVLMHLLEGPGPDSLEISLLSPEKRRESLETLILDLVVRLSSRPVLFLLEDVHWADEATLSLSKKAISRLSGAPVLVVLTARERKTLESAGLPPPTAAIGLGRLTRTACRSIVAALSREDLSPEAVREGLDRSDGVPLYIRELVLSGQLARGASGEIPPTLRDILASRIDALGEERRMLAVAACLGQSLDRDLLVAATERTLADLSGALHPSLWLRRLIEKGILEEDRPSPDPTFVFHHSLLREAVLASLPGSALRAIHGSIATTLAERFPERAEQSPEILAEHLKSAGRPLEAAERFAAAGSRAADLGVYGEAAAHFFKAKVLFEESDSPESRPALLRLLLLMGPVVKSSSGYGSKEMKEITDLASGLCATLPVTGEADFSALLGSAAATLAREGPKAAEEAAVRLLEAAEKLNNAEIEIRAEAFPGYLLFWKGEIGKALSALEAVEKRLAEAGERQAPSPSILFEDPALVVPSKLCLLEQISGNPDRALIRAAKVRELLSLQRSPRTSGLSLTLLALFHILRGEREEVARISRSSLEVAEKYGYRQLEALFLLLEAWSIPSPGRGRTVLVLESRIREILPGIFPVYSMVAAEILMEEGQWEKAVDLLGEAGRASEETGFGLFLPEILRLKGEGARKIGDPVLDEAASLFLSAADLAERSGSGWFSLRCALSLARHRPGAESRKTLRAAVAKIEGGDTLPAMREAREEIGGPSGRRAR